MGNRLRVTENEEAKVEITGRKNTKRLDEIIAYMKNADKLTVKINIDATGKKVAKTLKGKVIQSTDDFVVIKAQNYVESVRYIDVYTKKVTLVN